MATATDKYYCIGKWLQNRLRNLKDKDDKKVFKKVLLGFDKDKVKSFGDGVLATVYVTGTDYQETFGVHNRPVYIKSNIAFLIKGSSEAKYERAVHVFDLLQETFERDHDWQRLVDETTNKRIVRDTDVLSATLTLAPTGKRLDLVGVFELRHHVFK